MSSTFTTQVRLYPFSSTTGTSDGDGMATLYTYDGHYNINNLGGYVTLRVTSPQSPYVGTAPIAGYVERQLHTSSREIYVAQCPIVLAKNAKRLVWTAGVEGYAAGGTTQVTQFKVYLSSSPYAGDGPTSAFDTTKLSLGYLSRQVSLTISTTTRSYQLADDSSTGITGPAMPPTVGMKGADYFAYMIVTAVGFGSGVQGFVRLYDFTAWNLFE